MEDVFERPDGVSKEDCWRRDAGKAWPNGARSGSKLGIDLHFFHKSEMVDQVFSPSLRTRRLLTRRPVEYHCCMVRESNGPCWVPERSW